MVKTISQLNKLATLCHIFQNCGMLNSTVSKYAFALANSNLPAILPYGTHNDENRSDDDHNDDDGGPLLVPRALAQVILAVTQGLWSHERVWQCHDYHSTMLQNKATQLA